MSLKLNCGFGGNAQSLVALRKRQETILNYQKQDAIFNIYRWLVWCMYALHIPQETRILTEDTKQNCFCIKAFFQECNYKKWQHEAIITKCNLWFPLPGVGYTSSPWPRCKVTGYSTISNVSQPTHLMYIAVSWNLVSTQNSGFSLHPLTRCSVWASPSLSFKKFRST